MWFVRSQPCSFTCGLFVLSLVVYMWLVHVNAELLSAATCEFCTRKEYSWSRFIERFTESNQHRHTALLHWNAATTPHGYRQRHDRFESCRSFRADMLFINRPDGPSKYGNGVTGIIGRMPSLVTCVDWQKVAHLHTVKLQAYRSFDYTRNFRHTRSKVSSTVAAKFRNFTLRCVEESAGG